MNLLGCPVTDALLEHWSRHMVAPWAPFYLTDDERPLLPRGVVALTRAEIAADYSDPWPIPTATPAQTMRCGQRTACG